MKIILKNFLQKKIKFALLFLGIIILIFLIRKSGINVFLDIFTKLNWFYIIIAILLWIVVIILAAYRFHVIVNSELIFRESYKIYIYGFLSNYASFFQGLGMGVKVGLLKMKKVSITKSMATVTSELFYDIILSFFIVIVFFLDYSVPIIAQIKKIFNYHFFIYLIIIIPVAILIIWLFKNKYIKQYFYEVKERFNLKYIKIVLPLTILIWLINSITVLLYFKALNINITPWIILGGLASAFLFGLVSFIPGGLGVREGISSYIYSLSGVPLETTIPVTVINRIFGIFTVIILVIITKTQEFVMRKPQSGNIYQKINSE